MENEALTIGIIIICLAGGGAAGYYLFGGRKTLTLEQYKQKADGKLSKTENYAQEIKLEAKEKTNKIKDQSQNEQIMLQERTKRMEKIINSKKEQISKKDARNQVLQDMCEEENKKIKIIEEKNVRQGDEMTEKLADKMGMSIGQARQTVLDETASELERMKEERIKKYEQYLDDEKIRIAKNIIVNAIQKYSSPTSVEKRSLTIIVPRDDMKGKIIGYNLENLLLLEELTECDIIFNDAPNTIIISSFDLVKKHIGRETILKLLKEKVVNKEVIVRKIEEVKREMEKLLIKTGRETIQKLELKNRNFPDDFYKTIGRLQFRTSYGQNIIKHSIEVGTFALMLGSELDVNLDTCKIGGFLHDLGKAIDHEVGEPHDILTKQIMEEYGFSWEEIHAAWTHHDAAPIETAEALLVKAGDAISAGRPGARQETLEKYLERIKALEEIGNSYEGVNKAYAISAGRELRITIDPKVLDDEDLHELAKTVADEIEENVTYPGKIKVNVIRRTQSTDYVKK